MNGLWTTSSTPQARCLAGTLSGEHGIGTKIKWLEQETSHGMIIMFSRRLRKAFDLKGLFNPE